MAGDGIKVILLTGTKRGKVGDVAVLSTRVAEREINAGRAASAENGAGTATSVATPGVVDQLLFDASFGYVCTVGGTAGHATWKKWALSAA